MSTVLDVRVETIPAELKERDQWIVWEDKKPFNAETGKEASTTDPATWTSFDRAYAEYQVNQRWGGIGYVFSPDDPYTGIDLDEGANTSFIDILDSYTELSPSGTGVHIIVRGRMPGGKGRKTGPYEAYSQGRFFTMTGQHLEGTPETINERQEPLEYFIGKVFPERQQTRQQTRDYQAKRVPTETLLEKAFNARNGAKFRRLWAGEWESGYPSQSEADQALCGMLAFWTGPDAGWIDDLFRESGLYRDKWERADYRERTIGPVLNSLTDWHEWHPPTFSRNGTRTEQTYFRQTDLGNAERLVARHGDSILYSYELGHWLLWNGKQWKPDNAGRIEQLAKDTIRAIYHEVADIEDDKQREQLRKHATDSEKRFKLRAMIDSARSEVPVMADELDADRWLFNCLNGTIDLRTGELRPHDPHDRITRLAPVEYDPDADCPQFLTFLEQITGNDPALLAYLQRLLGYFLTGDVREQIFPIAWGTGANGKSTLFSTLLHIMGDYATQTPTTTFMRRRGDTIPNDLAALRGRRFVMASEIEDGHRLSESLVKQITGGDRISARFMRAEWFEYEPQFKVVLATNHKPVIRGTDHAIWRRIHLLPFAVTIPASEQDSELAMKLRSEAPGILAWLVDGCLAWQTDGLQPPDAVRNATRDYRSDQDVIEHWIQDECVIKPDVRQASKELYASYRRWCEQSGEDALTQRQFSERLNERGLESRRGSKGIRYRHGIGLLENHEKGLF